uniref:PPUP8806 n=1 Tax=Poeciliopsis prolifica TaxID=188132 RepID=A0A0S7EK83_9TELE
MEFTLLDPFRRKLTSTNKENIYFQFYSKFKQQKYLTTASPSCLTANRIARCVALSQSDACSARARTAAVNKPDASSSKMAATDSSQKVWERCSRVAGLRCQGNAPAGTRRTRCQKAKMAAAAC